MVEADVEDQDTLPVTPRSGIDELETLLADPMFEAGYILVQTIIDSAVLPIKTDEEAMLLAAQLQNSKRAELVQLREELAIRRDDPKLLDALDVWGRSPNSAGMRGPNGQGFNAGVVHYFGYRASEDIAKAARFREAGPPTIQGFIDISTYLASLIDNSRDTLALKMLSEVEDSEGQRRRFLLTWDNWIVVAFARPNDKMEAITLIPEQDREKFQIMVVNELNGAESPNRLNKLGDQRNQTI